MLGEFPYWTVSLLMNISKHALDMYVIHEHRTRTCGYNDPKRLKIISESLEIPASEIQISIQRALQNQYNLHFKLTP